MLIFARPVSDWKKSGIVWVLLASVSVIGCSGKDRKPENEVGPRFAVRADAETRAITEATGSEWVVSTQGRTATDAVDRTYTEGGNIIDAAIAASFAIGVERPQSTGIGGGGFMLYREAKTGKIYAIDFRERAPAKAYEKIYLDSKGEVIPDKSLVGIHAAGVPGLVKGLAEIHRKFGRIEWKTLLEPAIGLAENGVAVYPYLANALVEEREDLAKFPETKAIFLKKDGTPYREREVIAQTKLAQSLREIAAKGADGFYRGRIAHAIVRSTKGWISARDLANYKVRWLAPVRSTFHDYEVVSMPPPSSGGTHLIQILNLLEKEPLEKLGFQSPASLHLIASAMQRAYVDRARYMGDPDFVKIPLRTLTSKKYADQIRATIDPTRATPADALASAMPVLPEHSETTHFSIMDAEGNVVVSTQTINGWFGSKLVADGTGILLNNEMDDFSAKPGASNLFGAIGSKANSVQPGKTPLSSMSPTIVLEHGKPRLALGAPGGTRIITCVAQTILNALVYRLPLYDAVNALRIHEQWKPDVLNLEAPGFGEATEADLAARGWKLEKKGAGCAVMAVAREGNVLRGVSEPRDHGKAFAR
ncbi:MAG: gamma-glutamyltransferase [Bdellovibrionales bacterium]|nr:gamma-glutamyltransferase [Bdellovibrionales bacterium]